MKCEKMYRTKRKSNKTKKIIIVIILLAAIAAFCLYYSPYVFDKYGIKQPNKAISFEINDDNINDVPYCLSKEGIIKSVNLFKKYMSDTYGTNYTYTKGIYKINANMSYKQLGEKFQKPDSVAATVVIPEGKNCYEISKILEQNGICSSKDFIKALNDKYDYEFLSEIKNPEQRPYKLEGYLYPASYEIVEGSSAHDVIDMMLNAMQLRLEDGILEECESKGVSIDDVLTMASIVEKEASGYPADMGKVAGVFWNRLNNPTAQNTPTLGSDPTVHYADLLEKHKQNKAQHTLKSSEREKNVRGVFRAINKNEIEGKSVLIIDDIITTGNTLGECCRILIKAGAKRVCCAALCSA